MSIKKHDHKLKRKNYRNNESIYFCVLNCDYKVHTELALGKQVICWRCGRPFLMTEYSCRLAKPHCNACHVSKSDESAIKVDSSILEERTVANDIQIKITKADQSNTPDNLKDRLLASIGSILESDSDDML
jgi:transcription initiation factor IIE alpha subunit